MKNFILKLLFIILLVGFSGFSKEAQAIGSDFSITLIPQNPTPGAMVTAKVKSLHFDTSRASIIWKIDGKAVSAGADKDSVKFESPALGKKKTISASVVTADGESSSKSLVLVGNDMDLLWEALTTTPFNYRGKALSPVQSQIKVTAIPYIFENSLMLEDSDLIYEWYVNFNKDINASGAGKNYFILKIKDNDDYTVSLKVSNKASNIVFEKLIVLSGSNMKPKIIFYKEHPLEGPRYENALKEGFDIGYEEIGLRAEPFFFSSDNLSFNWKMNGKSISADEAPNILKLRAPEGEEGETSIGLDIKNNLNVLQFTSAVLKIIFGNNI